MFLRVTKLEDGTWTVKERLLPTDHEVNRVEKIDGRYFVTIYIEDITDDEGWLMAQALKEGSYLIALSLVKPSWRNDMGQL